MTPSEALEYNNAVAEAERARVEYEVAVANNYSNVVEYYKYYVALVDYANALYRNYNRTYR